ncbi:aminoglycoside phosphotransferase [Streptomyces sp. NPDC017405]|uniref:aminoglycoside phosphotransferase n=1 Tax=unclassified Streptomyces TaxID=2593676 RepID=UPI0037A9859E
MASRTAFEELPSAVRKAIELRTGRIHRVDPVSSGLNSQVAARLYCDAGDVHVKGLRSDHKWAWTQQREAEVSPYLRGISPELLWRVRESGWDVLGFSLITGHHAGYTPESPDLPLVVDLLTRLGGVEAPSIELREAGQRLSSYVDDPALLSLFEGNALLHTDLNNENVLIQGEHAYMVDWAWATRGAAWLDAGYWVIWLMVAGGHSAEQAEWWAAKVPSWRTAPCEGIKAFAVANANLWNEIGGNSPDPWTARMVLAAKEWAEYRSTLCS